MAGRKLRDYSCEGCGVPFQSDRDSPRFCSLHCSGSWRRAQTEHVTLSCEHCQQPFTCTREEMQRRKRRFCSVACSRPYINDARRGLPGRPQSCDHIAKRLATIAHRKAVGLLPPRRKPTEMKPCRACGEIVTRRRREAQDRWDTRQYCTVACFQQYCRKHPDMYPRWLGGGVAYYGPNWLQQARLARKRDKYTCQDCGTAQHRPALDVHHITPRRVFDTDHEAANHLDNLISLCKACHMLREAESVRRGETPAKGWRNPTWRDAIMPTPTIKICSRCKREKPLSSFHRARRGLGGVTGQCKECMADKYRESHPCSAAVRHEKACRDCGTVLPLTEFPQHKARGKYYALGRCRLCRNAEARIRRRRV